MTIDAAIKDTLNYLESDQAMASLAAHPYWPKWNSPWWHMLLLHELGETNQIPAPTIRAFISAINATPIKIFPIHDGEFPDGADPYRDTACHCQLGTVYRVLDAWGIDVDAELPWISPWFPKYQMPDGGLNCDESAYRVPDECPSSMVGTIAGFEAITLKSRTPLTPAQQTFRDHAAHFIIARRAMDGSTTHHNAAEREAAQEWPLPCFPRFYKYDVIRGLTALSHWAERTGTTLPAAAIKPALTTINDAFPDGTIRIGRRWWEGKGTRLQAENGAWHPNWHDETRFPLLEMVSKVGAVSPYLTQEWLGTRERLQKMMA